MFPHNGRVKEPSTLTTSSSSTERIYLPFSKAQPSASALGRRLAFLLVSSIHLACKALTGSSLCRSELLAGLEQESPAFCKLSFERSRSRGERSASMDKTYDSSICTL